MAHHASARPGRSREPVPARGRRTAPRLLAPPARQTPRNDHAGFAVRLAADAPEARLHARLRADPGSWHRRERDDVQLDRLEPAPADARPPPSRPPPRPERPDAPAQRPSAPVPRLD